MKIVIDRTRCATIGICESLEPDWFEIDDEGETQIVVGDHDEADRGRLDAVVHGCPTGALSIQD